MRTYPVLHKSDNKSIEDWINFVQRERNNDVNFINALPSSFISGRRVTKVPSGSTDVVIGDFVNDFNVTASYAYFCINNSSTLAWRRVAVSSW